APLKQDERVKGALAAIRGKHDLPGMIGAILRGETVDAIASVGVRKIGREHPMRLGDVVHIGSDTKAMTATLLGILVEEAKLAWSSTDGAGCTRRAQHTRDGV